MSTCPPAASGGSRLAGVVRAVSFAMLRLSGHAPASAPNAGGACDVVSAGAAACASAALM